LLLVSSAAGIRFTSRGESKRAALSATLLFVPGTNRFGAGG
jgi:hypothetical protein